MGVFFFFLLKGQQGSEMAKQMSSFAEGGVGEGKQRASRTMDVNWVGQWCDAEERGLLLSHKQPHEFLKDACDCFWLVFIYRWQKIRFCTTSPEAHAMFYFPMVDKQVRGAGFFFFFLPLASSWLFLDSTSCSGCGCCPRCSVFLGSTAFSEEESEGEPFDIYS